VLHSSIGPSALSRRLSRFDRAGVFIDLGQRWRQKLKNHIAVEGEQRFIKTIGVAAWRET
jgi:hypothetical protein